MLQRLWRAGFAASLMRLVCWMIVSSCWLAAQQTPADLILHNGKILTVDGQFSILQAVAVTRNQITAVGSDADVRKLAGPNTQMIDLKGRTVVPGLINTHLHFTGMDYAMNLSEPELTIYEVDWRGVRTMQDVLNQINAIMDKYKFKPGEWVHFRNRLSFMSLASEETARQSRILFDELNRWELDKVTPDNPIVMSVGVPEYNGLLLNGTAMDILWDEYGDFIKENGRFWIDSSGRPEGHLEAIATRLVMMKYMPHPMPEVLAPLFRNVLEELAAMGETTISARYPAYRVDALKLLESRGQLTARFAYGREEDFGTVTDLDSGMQALQGVVGSGSGKIWINSIAPSSIDGSGSRMCTNLEKSGSGAIDHLYPIGQCYQDIEFRGAAGKAAPLQKNYYREWVTASARFGIRYANTHVSGDRSMELLLRAMDQAQQQFGPSAIKGWALDHCDLVSPEALRLGVKLGVMFSCYTMSIEQGQEIEMQYGEEVAQTYIVPVKSMIDGGLKPVYESEGRGRWAWYDLSQFITRKDRQGRVWGAPGKNRSCHGLEDGHPLGS